MLIEYGYVTSSAYRTKVLKSLDGDTKMPSQIARDSDIKQNQIYNVINQLKKHELVECINPEVRKGKLYRLTDKGEEIIKEMD